MHLYPTAGFLDLTEIIIFYEYKYTFFLVLVA
jgi:hypothetical protein